MTHTLLEDIGLALIAATVLGLLAERLRQPVILGYLVAGALIGPEIGFKLVSDLQNIDTISEIGLILLLFVVGLELNPQQVIRSGKHVLITGFGQYILCVLFGLGFFLLMGYSLTKQDMGALYLALLCAMSSTAIVAKLLFDKLELETIHGRITLGVLVIQDLWAIVILAFQPNLANPKFSLMGLAILKAAALALVAFALSRYVLSRIYNWVSKLPEMIVATSLGWCAIVAGAGGMLGLSKEMGALIAGVAISSFPYSVHVTEKTLPLRDFFLTLFFVSIGMKMIAPKPEMMFATAAIVAFVIASRLLTVYPILSLLGAGRRTCLITSIDLAQLSEFSLVLAAIGVTLGHIGKDIMALILYSMAVTAVMSSYFVKYNHSIFHAFDKLMTRIGFKPAMGHDDDDSGRKSHAKDVIVLGYHRGTQALFDILSRRNPRLLQEILVVDFNLEVVKELRKKGMATVLGDVSSIDTLRHAGVENAKIILSTIPDALLKGTTNAKLVRTCRELSPDAFIVAMAEFKDQIAQLKRAGANEIIAPYSLLAEHLTDLLAVWYWDPEREKEAETRQHTQQQA